MGIERWKHTQGYMEPHEDGKWVRYDDHLASLNAEREKYAALLAAVDAVTAWFVDHPGSDAKRFYADYPDLHGLLNTLIEAREKVR